MWDLRAALEISQTALGAVSCFYFFGAQFKKTEVRGHNRYLVIIILTTILLALLAEQCLIVSAARTVPDFLPFAAVILYTLALVLQINRLYPYTSEEENTESAWHAFFGSWAALFVYDVIAIIKLALTTRPYTPILICATVAIGIRCILEFFLLTKPTKPDEGHIRLREVENGIMGMDSSSESSPLEQSILHEIRADGGFWPWLKKFQIFLPWIWPSGVPWIKARLLANLVLQWIEIALKLTRPRLYSAFVSRLEQAFAHREHSLVWSVFSSLVVIYLLDGSLGSLRRLLWRRLKVYQTLLANEDIHRHLMDHEATFHNKTNSTQMLMACDKGLDVLAACDLIFEDVVPCITQFVLANLQIGATYSSHVALLQVFFTALDMMGTIRMSRTLIPIQDAAYRAREKARRRREEGLKSWFTVKVFGQTDHEIHAYTTLHGREMQTGWRSLTCRTMYMLISSWIVTVAKFAAMALAILHGIKTGGLVGDVLALDMYWDILQQPMRLLARIPPMLYDQLSAGCQLRRLLEITPRMKYGTAELHPTEGRITFRNVSFGYTGTDGKVKRIFCRLNLTIQPGKATAIVGPSGVGKTTITNLITRLYDPDEGSVEIDGQDIKSLRKGELSKHVTFMEQTPFILDADFETNIKFGRPDATSQEVEDAAKNAGIYARIMEGDERYRAQVGEGGRNLSGGEKQRLVLARTLLRKTPIVCFDEATSALDADAEAHAMEGTKAACAQSTTITIAHRLSSIKQADHILVLGKGDDGYSKIVEEGSHEELVARGGAYARLWDHHTGNTSGRSLLKNSAMRRRVRSSSLQ